MSKPKRRYDYFPDLPDKRDHYYRPPSLVEVRPQYISLVKNVTRIEDQGNLGSCVANGVTSIYESLDFQTDRHYFNRSRLFCYYTGRLIEGTVNQDSGIYVRDGIKAVVKNGLPTEKVWPYDITKFKQKPSAKAYLDASQHLVLEYQRVDQTREALLGALSEGHMVVFGFSVYDSFESSATLKTGVVTMPLSSESLLGGHCMYACGYDVSNPSNETVLTVNSWGKAVGMRPAGAKYRGFFQFPLAYLLDGDLAEDFWIIKKSKESNFPNEHTFHRSRVVMQPHGRTEIRP